MVHRLLRLAAAASVVLALGACGGGSSLDARCRSVPRSDQLSCHDAVALAENVASDASIRSAQGRVVAYIHRQGVSEGHSVSAWFVEFIDPVLEVGTTQCPSTEFTVILHAGSGRFLAHDIPECLRQ